MGRNTSHCMHQLFTSPGTPKVLKLASIANCCEWFCVLHTFAFCAPPLPFSSLKSQPQQGVIPAHVHQRGLTWTGSPTSHLTQKSHPPLPCFFRRCVWALPDRQRWHQAVVQVVGASKLPGSTWARYYTCQDQGDFLACLEWPKNRTARINHGLSMGATCT